MHKIMQLFSKFAPGCSILACFCVSPCGYIGGEVGTVVGIHELGSASDVFPLSGSSATYRRFTAFYKKTFFQPTPSGMNLLSLTLSQCPSPGRTPVCFSLFQATWQGSYIKSG